MKKFFVYIKSKIFKIFLIFLAKKEDENMLIDLVTKTNMALGKSKFISNGISYEYTI